MGPEMPRSLLVCILVVFFTIPMVALQCRATCDSLLLSLSSAGICEDSACRSKEIVQTRMQLGKGHAACFRVDQSQFDALDKTINITILDSWVSYPVHNCYTTDDPQVDLAGYCACSLSSPVDCGNCPIPVVGNTTSVCGSGVNRGTGCFGFRTASHCVRATFNGGSRYKVCSIGDPKLEVMYRVYDSESYHTGTLTVTDESSIVTSQANITFYDIQGLVKLKGDLVVVDLLNNFRVFLIPADRINSYSTTDINKLGWFRANTTISPLIMNQITVNVADCSEDMFGFGVGFTFLKDLLGNHPEWQSENRVPGILFSDPDAAPIQAGQVVYDPPLPALLDGAYFLSLTGEIIPFGLDQYGVPVQIGTRVGSSVIKTNVGVMNQALPYTTYLCSEEITLTHNTTIENGVESLLTWSISQCNAPYVTGDPNVKWMWGLCMVYQNVTPGKPNIIIPTCDNVQFRGIRWPDNNDGSWLPAIGNVSHPYYRLYSNIPIVPQYSLHSDHLVLNNHAARGNVDVEFLNITIYFDVTNVQPQITKIDHDDDNIYVWAESTTVKGNCLLFASDNIAPSKSIELTLAQNKYKLPLLLNKFKGDIDITIQCYKNKDVVKFNIEIERGDLDINYNSINDTAVRRLSKDESIWDKAARGASKSGWWFVDTISAIWDLTNNAVGNFFLGLLITTLIVLLTPVVIYFAFKALYWALCWMWSKVNLRVRMRSYGKSKINTMIPMFANKKA